MSVGDVESILFEPTVKFDSLTFIAPQAINDNAWIDVDAIRFFVPHGYWNIFRKQTSLQMTFSLPVSFDPVRLKRTYVSVSGRRVSASGPMFQSFRLGSVLCDTFWFRLSVLFLRSANVNARLVKDLLVQAAEATADPHCLNGSDFILSLKHGSGTRHFVSMPPDYTHRFFLELQRSCTTYSGCCWVRSSLYAFVLYISML